MDNQAQPGKIMRGLQTPYIAVLNVFYFLTKWIGEKVRNMIVFASCFGLVIYAALQYSEIFIRDHIHDVNYRMLIICVLIALIALFGMKEKAKPIAWSWPPLIFLYGLAVCILIARYHHGLATGYVLYALLMIVIIPAYGIVWTGKENYRELFDKLAIALEVIGLLFYIGSVIVWPYAPYLFANGRYTGLTTNTNILAMFYLCVMIASFYMIYHARWLVFSIITLGISLGLLYLTESRTAILAAVVAVVAFVISYLRKREPDRISPKRLLVAVVLVIVAAILALFVVSAPVKYFHYYGIESIKDEYNSGSKYSLKECEEMGIPVGAVPYDVQYIRADQNVTLVEQRASADKKEFTITVPPALYGKLDTISSGRAGVYLWIIQTTNPWGEIPWGTDRDQNSIAVNGNVYNGAHNTVLDFTYQCGWAGGISCLLLKLSMIIFALCFVFGKKKYRPGMLFVVLMIAIYAVESALEIQTLPSSRDITCYYYLVIPFVFAGIKQKTVKG